jgi:hypothetical protein
MNNYALFLDDERFPKDVTWERYFIPLDTFRIVRNYQEFVNIIHARGMPDFISFDNDLGEEKEGYDCAKWLINHCIDKDLSFPNYVVHSKNPIAKDRIISIIENYLRTL